jgi:hypothetical protein
MASPEAAAEFERRFVERARRYLTGKWSGTDHGSGRTSRSKRTWWLWFQAEEVTTRGVFPATELLVIGRGDHDASCRFGFALPIWFEHGEGSWDMPDRWEPEWGADAAQMLCYNVFEEAAWTIGVPKRPPCVPDESGITWITLPAST